jgi:hypothetical protein
MKKCDYCGQLTDDAATTCRGCGSSGFAAPGESVAVADPRKLEPDEIPLTAIARKDGSAITLKCRTPEEAYLVCDELEKADILTILPDEEELLSLFRRDGFVEVRVSAKAYESVADLRSAVEFQYKRVRADQPLANFGKVVGMGCAIMIVPGLLVFAWLLTSYRKHGYDRRAKEFKFWFFLGVAAWLLLLAACFAFGCAGAAQRGPRESAHPTIHRTRASRSARRVLVADWRLARGADAARSLWRLTLWE